MVRTGIFLLGVLLAGVLGGCSNPANQNAPTGIPERYLATSYLAGTTYRARSLDDVDPTWQSFVRQYNMTANPGMLPASSTDGAPAATYFGAIVSRDDEADFLFSYVNVFASHEAALAYWQTRGCVELNFDNSRMLLDGQVLVRLLPGRTSAGLRDVAQVIGDDILHNSTAQEICPGLFRLTNPQGLAQTYPAAFEITQQGGVSGLRLATRSEGQAIEQSRGFTMNTNPGTAGFPQISEATGYSAPLCNNLELLTDANVTVLLENFVVVFPHTDDASLWISGVHQGPGPLQILQHGPAVLFLRSNENTTAARGWINEAASMLSQKTGSKIIFAPLEVA